MRSLPSTFLHGFHRVLPALLILCMAIALGWPSPAAACEQDPTASFLYESHVEPGVLPGGVSIMVGQELSVWVDDPQLQSFTIDNPGSEYDQPLLSAGTFETASDTIFGVRNDTASTIYVLHDGVTGETPDPSMADLPPGKTVAYTVGPRTAVAFSDIPDAQFAEELRKAGSGEFFSLPTLTAHLTLLIGGEVVTTDIAVTLRPNPEIEEARRRMEECARITGGDTGPKGPSGWEIGLALAGLIIIVGVVITLSKG